MKNNFVMKPFAGSTFDSVVKQAIALAKEAQNYSVSRNVEFDFNGILCVVCPKTDPVLLYRDFCNAYLMRWKKIGPHCGKAYNKATRDLIISNKKEQEERSRISAEKYQEKIRLREETASKKLEGIEMEFSDKESWDKRFELNSDAYGRGCYTFAERWAKLMQWEMKDRNFTTIDGVGMIAFADSTSHEADIEGITGFMYGAAVKILSDCWKYGEVLRKWHNKEYGHEGEGVVNPAMLTISSKE